MSKEISNYSMGNLENLTEKVLLKLKQVSQTA